MKKKILILTEPTDVHAFAVAEALLQKGAEPILWYTADFPARSCESVLFEQNRIQMDICGLQHGLDLDVDTVWHRRPSFALDQSVLNPADVKFAELETSVFRRSLWSILAPGAFWVNPHDAASRAGRKLLQHDAAVRTGFEVPDTLYSNDPALIRDFIRRHGNQIVYKPFKALPWRNEETYWVPYTSVLSEDRLVDDSLLKSTPGIYQALIPKSYELRVTVMGRRAFAAKVLSQDTQKGQLDWRKAYDELRMEPFEIPAWLAELCCELLRQLGLVFGCFDFIVTPEEKYVFLEVNEMGQFLFIEQYAGVPLLHAFSEFLLQGRLDFEWDESSVAIRYADVQGRVEVLAAAAARLHASPADQSLWEGEYRRPSETR